jgi:uncharacterized membrane protein YecN with MAPEG domain
MPITAFYAALLALLFMVLSFRTIQQRRSAKVELGTGEDAELLRRYRVHANFAEYVPLALVLLGLAESLKAPHALLHLAGFTLLSGRVVHAYGLSQTSHILRLRIIGMILTFGAITLTAVVCLVLAMLYSAI